MERAAPAKVNALYRYPVKGLSAQALVRVPLSAGATLPLDRAYAIANGPGPFDPACPKYLSKIHFLMLMRNEQLAALDCDFEDASHALVIVQNGNEVVRGDLRTNEGRQRIESFLAGYLPATAQRGPPRILLAGGHSFSDVAAKCVHVINLASVRSLATVMGAPVDPRRFRANILIDGPAAWSELDWVGKTLRCGDSLLEVFSPTERCAATNVDPTTGTRDLKIPSLLSRTKGHTNFGVYARVTRGGTIATGDAVEIPAS